MRFGIRNLEVVSKHGRKESKVCSEDVQCTKLCLDVAYLQTIRPAAPTVSNEKAEDQEES